MSDETIYCVQFCGIVEGSEAAERLAHEFESVDPTISLTRTVTVVDRAALAALVLPLVAAATAGGN